jgi:hypothetical protein
MSFQIAVSGSSELSGEVLAETKDRMKAFSQMLLDLGVLLIICLQPSIYRTFPTTKQAILFHIPGLATDKSARITRINVKEISVLTIVRLLVFLARN